MSFEASPTLQVRASVQAQNGSRYPRPW